MHCWKISRWIHVIKLKNLDADKESSWPPIDKNLIYDQKRLFKATSLVYIYKLTNTILTVNNLGSACSSKNNA